MLGKLKIMFLAINKEGCSEQPTEKYLSSSLPDLVLTSYVPSYLPHDESFSSAPAKYFDYSESRSILFW